MDLAAVRGVPRDGCHWFVVLGGSSEKPFSTEGHPVVEIPDITTKSRDYTYIPIISPVLTWLFGKWFAMWGWGLDEHGNLVKKSKEPNKGATT
jgi:hypothetical protein